LAIANSGEDLPPGFNPATQKTLGMHLVMMLTDQLQARLQVSRKAGTRFRIILPMGLKNK
jgi:two-component sensor histidine kinase